MATLKQIQEALKGLSGGGLDVKGLTKEVIKANLKGNYPDESLEEISQKICEDGTSFLYKSAFSKLTQLSGALVTLPGMATSLISQLSTIPASVIGPAAVAAPSLVSSVKSQIQGLKSQLTQALQTASELGIDLPVDPLLDIIKIIKPFL